MKRQISFLLLIAALALPSLAAAQILDGDVKEVSFISTSGSYGGTSLPFFNFDITGMPGTPYWDFLCVDNINYIPNPTTYDARFTAVETQPLDNLRYTREGSDQLRAGGTLGTALTNYRIAAYLYLRVQEETAGLNRAAELLDLQHAVWFATNPTYDPLWENHYYTTAQAAVAGGWTADYFFVVTATDDIIQENGEYRIRATGGAQEHLVYAAPEPGTVLLLATGLLGVAYVGRRRRKLTELDIEA
jgi:hypothetical protein